MIFSSDPRENELEIKAEEIEHDSRLYFKWAHAYVRRCRERSVPIDDQVYDDMCRAWMLSRSRYHRIRSQLDLLRYKNLSQ